MRRTVVFVGGGLANSLAAWRLAQLRPEVDFALVEAGARLGQRDGSNASDGEHTWCLHDSDIGPHSSWLRPLYHRSWDGYDVRFPGFTRRFTDGYHALRSRQVHDTISAALGDRLLLKARAVDVAPGLVRLADGRTFEAGCVVDGRGDDPSLSRAWTGYQKFCGWFIRCERPHGVERPLLMDATVAQRDGYRYLYVLPWSEHELLVEDTRYSRSPALHHEEFRRCLAEELQLRRFGPFVVEAEEHGVLRVPLLGAPRPLLPPGIVTSGVRAGLYHPTTGYSLPEAVRFAEWFAAAPRFDDLARTSVRRARAVWRRGRLCRRLNNMLFLAAEPDARRGVLAQFYGRDDALIARFYRGDLRWRDCLRLISGPSPVPLGPGLWAFVARAALG